MEHMLEDEAAEEQEFHSMNHLSPFHAGVGTMVHSPTTDTLDSVALEPSPTDDYEEVNEEADGQITSTKNTENREKDSVESTEKNPEKISGEKLATFSIEGISDEKEVTETPNASCYFTAG